MDPSTGERDPLCQPLPVTGVSVEVVVMIAGVVALVGILVIVLARPTAPRRGRSGSVS